MLTKRSNSTIYNKNDDNSIQSNSNYNKEDKSSTNQIIFYIIMSIVLLIIGYHILYHNKHNNTSNIPIINYNNNVNTINNLRNNNNDPYIHIVFSTDCSFFQDWQTLVVFHSATLIRQTGTITRIASGCSETKKDELITLYKKLFPNYKIHFTPDFKVDSKTGKSYDFYNKPYGLQHWLNNTKPISNREEIVVLIDPDMILLRPIDLTIRGNQANIYFENGIDTNSPNLPDRVRRGSPVAEVYGLEAPWANDHHKNFNRTKICGVDSPCLKVEQRFGELHYSVGPPYLVERSDLVRITNSWTKFVPRVYEKYPELLAEMYAYSMAAAHENLPHTILTSYMISNTDMDEEGWKYIDELKDDVCQPYVNNILYPNRNLPTVLHYCQFYRVGKYGFQKRRIPKYLFSCDYPLLQELPTSLGNITYKNRDGEIIEISEKKARRDSFMLCTIYKTLNSLLIYYKQNMCNNKNDKINLDKVVNVVELKY